MTKEKTYSKEEALKGAMALFWRKGYHNSSMDMLVRTTGVSRYSFYEQFGGKRDLFLQTLNYYIEHILRPRLSILENSKAGLDEIKGFFARMVIAANSDQAKQGCFYCNSITEMAMHDVEIAQMLDEHRQYAIALFIRALRNGVGGEKMRRDISLEGVASQLFLLQQGMMVMSRIPGSGKLTEKAVHAALLALKTETQVLEAA